MRTRDTRLGSTFAVWVMESDTKSEIFIFGPDPHRGGIHFTSCRHRIWVRRQITTDPIGSGSGSGTEPFSFFPRSSFRRIVLFLKSGSVRRRDRRIRFRNLSVGVSTRSTRGRPFPSNTGSKTGTMVRLGINSGIIEDSEVSDGILMVTPSTRVDGWPACFGQREVGNAPITERNPHSPFS